MAKVAEVAAKAAVRVVETLPRLGRLAEKLETSAERIVVGSQQRLLRSVRIFVLRRGLQATNGRISTC